MERRRVSEGSALGAPIDTGQIGWNNQLYQNARRVRSLVRNRQQKDWKKIERRIIHKIENTIESSTSVHEPVTVYEDAALEADPGILRIENGNSLTTGSDLGGMFLNGRTLPTILAGRALTVAITTDGNWYVL